MPATAALRLPPRARPRGSAPLRLALRVAAGLTPAQAAAAEGPRRAAQAEALVAEPDFAPLVAACEGLRALPEADRLARLEAQAWDALELALIDPADPRVVFFVLLELKRGRNPAATLAKGADAAWRRTAKAPSPPRSPALRLVPPPTSPRGPSPDSGAAHANTMAARGAARLRRDVLEEDVARRAAMAEATEPPSPQPSPIPPGRERGHERSRDLAPSPVRSMGEGRGEGGAQAPRAPPYPRVERRWPPRRPQGP